MSPCEVIRRPASEVLIAACDVCMAVRHADPTAAVLIIASLPLLLLLFLWHKHRIARQLLRTGRCNLPTTVWRPKFVNYAPDLDDKSTADEGKSSRCFGTPRKKLASSTITNILPRMERLGGPYGMYGTIYGVSTRVVHVGHPVPAKAILSGTAGLTGKGASQAGNSFFSSSTKRRRLSTFSASSGATKAPAYDHFKNFSGDGVFTADGEDWKSKRSSVIHCLLRGCTGEKSEGMRRLEQEANKAADSFLRHTQGKKGKNLNVVPILQRATVALIYRFITHHDIEMCRCRDCVRGTDECCNDDLVCLTSITPTSSSTSLSSVSETSTAMDVLCDEVKASDDDNDADIESLPSRILLSYLKAVTHIRMIILAQSRSFWFLMPRWIYKAFSPMYRTEQDTMGPIREFARAACVNARDGSPLASLRRRPSHAGPEKSRFVDVPKAILDEAITLLFAGQDPSAATLSWTLHLLALHPQVQDRLAQELCKCIQGSDPKPDNRKASFVTKQDISKMPYLDAVIKESMRLYPVAPFVVRRLPQNTPIPRENKSDRSVILPEGSLACIWIYALHRNPKLWHRPNDFVPERWLDPEIRRLDDGQTSGAFLPFAHGPRNCLGQPLAHVILRIVLARIISSSKVVDEGLEALEKKRDASKNGKYDVDPLMFLRKDMQAGFTVLPCGGVNLSLRDR